MNSIGNRNSAALENTDNTFLLALTLVKKPLLIALFLTPLRFLLELSGLPEKAIFLVGLLWFTLGYAVYLGIVLSKEEQPFRTLLLALLIFSPISRIPVAIMWWIDKKFTLGTHYGLYFDNFPQAILNHIFYGSLVQLIPGCVLGGITLAVIHYRNHRSN